MTKSCLSLDGGGSRALRTLQILKYIEAKTGKRVYALFDLLIGSSTGAILALALAQMSATEAEVMYLKLCPKIFTRSAWQSVKTLGGIAGNKYDTSILEAELKGIFGDRPMPDRICVTAYDATNGTPYIFGSGSKHTHAWQAARASSAAPTYFDPAVINGVAYEDGGLCCNSPAMWGYILTAPALVLSIGTGDGFTGAPTGSVLHRKPLEDIGPALSAAMDGASALVDLQLSIMLGAERYLRIQSTFTNQTMDEANPEALAQFVADGARMLAKQQSALDAFIAKL